MSGTDKSQASLRSFFKPASQSASSPAMPSRQVLSPVTFTAPSNFPHPAFGTARGSSTSSDHNVRRTTTRATKPPSRPAYASSLSPATSSSELSEAPPSPPKAAIQQNSVLPKILSDQEVKGSDDEDSDSDSSLVDLSVLLGSHSSGSQKRTSTSVHASSTPARSKAVGSGRLHKSPLPVQTKYNFDLKSLIRQAHKDDAAEASSKRVKAMLIPTKGSASNSMLTQETPSNVIRMSHHGELLESVVAETEGGEMDRVNRALMRTEATLPEYRWYFFEAESKISDPERTPFPTSAIPENWLDDLKDPKWRYQTFVSGFAEDIVGYGKTLPDEIFLWMLDELCLEPNDVLRSSYSNVLRASSEQVSRLVVASVIQEMFQKVGGNSTAITVSQLIRPVQQILKPYCGREWARLHSFIKFLGQASKSFQLEARMQAFSTLLRMGIDRVVVDNIDLHDMVQHTIFRLCRHVPDDSWEIFCQEICKTMFSYVEKPTFRLQIVETLPSTSPKTHDLRRRLAMAFYFNDLSHSMKHSHESMDLTQFIDRLHGEDFDAMPETDYRELAALVGLLDVAVDDARSLDLDLSEPKTEKRFNANIDAFAAALKEIIRSIGSPGTAFISKIDAKELLLLVGQRIGATLRSRPKPKSSVWDIPGAPEEDIEAQQDFMAGFLSRRPAEDVKGRIAP